MLLMVSGGGRKSKSVEVQPLLSRRVQYRRITGKSSTSRSCRNGERVNITLGKGRNRHQAGDSAWSLHLHLLLAALAH